MRLFKSSLFLWMGVLALLTPPAFSADVYLGLQAYGGNGKTLGVGLPDFKAATTEASDIAKTLRSVLREDLLFERMFTIAENGPLPSDGKLDALAWSALGAHVVVTADVSLQGEDVTLECKVYDVGSGKVIFGKQGSGTKASLRRLAHLLADDLTFKFSGQPGIAHSRIAFVNDGTRHKEVYVMDYDGANVQQLTRHRSIALLPKWGSDGKSIVFNSYRAQNPDAYVLEYPGGGLRELSTRQGLNTAPNWSPDMSMLALTISRGADPDLFLIDASGKVIRRLTFTPGVDTSPSFSPNGQQIVFVSDRAGNPELYVMDITGANVQRLTYGQYVDAPAWSPRGDLIAYERRREGGQYDIALIDPQGRNGRTITEGSGRNENPTWSPDGRFLTFTSTRDGKRQIYIMTVDGDAVHAVSKMPGDSYYPSWGP